APPCRSSLCERTTLAPSRLLARSPPTTALGKAPQPAPDLFPPQPQQQPRQGEIQSGLQPAAFLRPPEVDATQDYDYIDQPVKLLPASSQGPHQPGNRGDGQGRQYQPDAEPQQDIGALHQLLPDQRPGKGQVRREAGGEVHTGPGKAPQPQGPPQPVEAGHFQDPGQG